MDLMIIDFAIYLIATVMIMCFAISYIDFKEASKWKNSK